MSKFLGRMLKEGLAEIGIQATNTYKDQYYRIRFKSFKSFISFFHKYFLPYRIEVKENKEEKIEIRHDPYQVQFAVEELPDNLRDIDILRILMDLTKKVGLKPKYKKKIGVCSVNLPFEACFVLFLELVQKLFNKPA